ncbi:hypothetical protein KO561_02510 [Radiobacillus kanasensis]|uniref:hypothetical protein n=1 Tax=Radiobacillus kanasensis TaxID=2844358 RepID=UPI001E349CF9|nr:hypothetical protein [Radiobacillus kanasensis]UFT99852.1 hypothetical protein KO561_02510 [Radiobacillus kanasensis]
MTGVLYQAKIGDGFEKKGLIRRGTFFNTPKEAVSEAFQLKERMDKKYKNKIVWNYDGDMKGSSKKLKILRGFLNGDIESEPFYLQIVSVTKDRRSAVSPNHAKKVTIKDKKILEKVVEFLK